MNVDLSADTHRHTYEQCNAMLIVRQMNIEMVECCCRHGIKIQFE